MNPLPQTYLQWDESAEPLATFVRYQVYRRVFGDSTWHKIERIYDRARNYASDFEQSPDTTYEYAVTQVAIIGADEVESAFGTIVQAQIDCQNLFVHLRDNPGVYAELEVMGMDDEQVPEIVFQQSRASRTPTAYTGQSRPRTLGMDADAAWTDKRQIEDAAVALLEGQGTAGGVVARWYGSPLLYGVLTTFRQRLGTGSTSWHIEATEVEAPEDEP